MTDRCLSLEVAEGSAEGSAISISFVFRNQCASPPQLDLLLVASVFFRRLRSAPTANARNHSISPLVLQVAWEGVGRCLYNEYTQRKQWNYSDFYLTNSHYVRILQFLNCSILCIHNTFSDNEYKY